MTRLARMRQVLDDYFAAKQTLVAPLPVSEYEDWNRRSDFYHAKDALYNLMTPETFEQLLTLAEAAAKEVTDGVVNDDLDDAVMSLLEEEE